MIAVADEAVIADEEEMTVDGGPVTIGGNKAIGKNGKMELQNQKLNRSRLRVIRLQEIHHRHHRDRLQGRYLSLHQGKSHSQQNFRQLG